MASSSWNAGTTIAIIFFILHRNFVLAIPTVTLLPSGCGSLGANPGQIILSGGGLNYTDPVNCSLTMTATSSAHRIRFAFNTGTGDVGIVNNPNPGSGSCPQASVQIFDGPSVTQSPRRTFCGNLLSTETLSTGDTLTLLVLSNGGSGTNINFTAHYTSFTESADCGADFPCNNGRCISPTMKCDTTLINNCGDFSDNSEDPPANCTVDAFTTSPMDTTAEQTTSTPPSESDTSAVIYAAAVIGGIFGLYFLHWLLFRPGWLVWRMGCFRHLRCCRSCNGSGSSKNSVDAAKPLTSSMNNINSKKSDGMYSDSPTSNRSVPIESSVQTSEINHSYSPFVEGIKREQHVFTLPA
uniref:uncharacterized protein LOC120334505 n=1 Tax=Styela clava TaxID=7725 RepID=UPI00193AD0EB|nr:uncharacterized protein LOC120334505 [Styela clava]